MDIKNKIGKRLKEVREEKGMTQAEVATAAGINSNYYTRLERDKENVSIETFEKSVELITKSQRES